MQRKTSWPTSALERMLGWKTAFRFLGLDDEVTPVVTLANVSDVTGQIRSPRARGGKPIDAAVAEHGTVVVRTTAPGGCLAVVTLSMANLGFAAGQNVLAIYDTAVLPALIGETDVSMHDYGGATAGSLKQTKVRIGRVAAGANYSALVDNFPVHHHLAGDRPKPWAVYLEPGYSAFWGNGVANEKVWNDIDVIEFPGGFGIA